MFSCVDVHLHYNYNNNNDMLIIKKILAHVTSLLVSDPSVMKGLLEWERMLFSVERNLATLDLVSARLNSSSSSCLRGKGFKACK